MDTKKHISKRTFDEAMKASDLGLFVPVVNLNRYIRGERIPSLKVARTISQITRSKKDIWLDRGCVEQRKEALKLYGKINNTVSQFRRGRPKTKHTTIVDSVIGEQHE